MKLTLKKIVHFPIVKMVLGIAICLAVLIGIQNLVTKPLIHHFIDSKPIGDTIVNYISVVVLLACYFYFFKIADKRDIKELSKTNLKTELFGGFLFGFSVLSLVILILYLLGYFTVDGISDFSYLLAPFSFLIIAALIEEVFFRLIIYRITENWLGTYLALLIISIIFTVPHLLNDNVTLLSVLLLLTFGFAHSIMYTYTKRLWLPFAFHLGWNFAQPFYGSNLSGTEEEHILNSNFNGPTLLIGSDFGIEDSIFSIILLLIVCILFLRLSIRQNKIVKTSYSKSYK
ncbi:CPBP family intramembrane glutamic endopeptidase [Flagellimonas sp. CMM7]|uniref:CPBP family intramembrane glutamic endopeptidase n=1 Tax=Flagellimonas sp. CMM7 TaxID=2654676 RepID=UPI0013D1FFFC|nr:CPBP family intramembrane glutamic endopeptidase [Flagellimonas sp. CMM7]UII79450.1 CPBP family intramembrane metalloprotease [Flagellimonas sp. CMM7]